MAEKKKDEKPAESTQGEPQAKPAPTEQPKRRRHADEYPHEAELADD